MNGRRIVLTGSRPGAYAARLRASGAIPIAIPMIEIRPIASAELDEALRELERFDWVAVTSPNGVRSVFDRLDELDVTPPPSLRWAAVGPATRSALETRGVAVDVTPRAGVGVAIAEALGDLSGARVLLPRSAAASDELPRALATRGARVRAIDAYETVEGPETSRASLGEALERGVDAVVFTSGSTVRGWARLTGSPAESLAGAVVTAIGPVTADVSRDLGLAPVTVAEERTPDGVVRALERALVAACESPGRSGGG